MGYFASLLHPRKKKLATIFSQGHVCVWGGGGGGGVTITLVLCVLLFSKLGYH